MRHTTCIWAITGLLIAGPYGVAEAAGPAELPTDWQATVEERIRGEEYHFSLQDDGRFWAPNRAHDLRAQVGKYGLVVTSRTAGEDESAGGFMLGMRLSAWGRPQAMHELVAGVASAHDGRVEIDHSALIEWYSNTPAGLEQGFTIPAPQPGKRAHPLVLEFALDGGLGAFPSEDGQEVVFKTARGTSVLRYASLAVRDATASPVPARIAFLVGRLQIRIEDRDAVYPLEVDPLLTSPAWTAESNQGGAIFGYSVATAGDVDGDGYSDVVVGAYLYDNGQSDEGRAFIYRGSAAGLTATPAWTAESDQASSGFGLSVASAGDINADGYADWLVGAPYFDNDVPGTNHGRVFVYHGTAAGLATAFVYTAASNQAQAEFGVSVGTAGDVNGDGYSDVVIGAWHYDNGQSDEGRAFVYHGWAAGLISAPAWTAESNQASSVFGLAVATAGDVNGDGYSDVIVGAYEYGNGQSGEGRAFVYHGSASGLEASATWTAESNQPFANLGYSVATAGDVNGDGYADAIVGAPQYSNGQTEEGGAFVYLGSAAGLAAAPAWTAESDQASAELGLSVAPAGDINGDGFADVIAGAWLYDNGQADAGRTFLYTGSAVGLSASPAWTAESTQATSSYGYSVATAGDVNGDGYSDVLVGAYLYDSGQNDEGRVFVYYGSASGPASGAAWTSESDQNNAGYGVSVSGAGDVNGDGYSDVIVGAYQYDNGQNNEGRAYAFLGSATGLETSASWTAESDQIMALFGFAVAGAGDVNGDGYDDVIVGAELYDNVPNNEGRVYVFHGSAAGLGAGAVWTAESDKANSVFGIAVAGAGDVNGDGYSDVVVGASQFDNGNVQGRAFVYHGSAAGLGATPTWTAEGDQGGSEYGRTVATAGDVNGDGYSDLIVGAISYDNGDVNEGRAFVYYGSAAGLATSPAWTAEGNQPSAQFGWIAPAGDVNGDGYSDVIVGARAYDSAGSAFVYYGSTNGLALAPAWTAESGQAGAEFGLAVAGAGDVNGDGYSDVVVGAYQYDNGQSNEGRAFVYVGSAAGLGLIPAWTAESDQIDGFYGWSVGTAGDVNGDGYSEVILGARQYSAPQSQEGRAFVYYGNGGDGLERIPRQARADGSAPIAALGKSDSNTSFRLHARGRSPAGRSKVRLEWERKLLGEAFDGTGLTRQGTLTDTAAPVGGGSSVALETLVSGLPADSVHHWRVHILSDSPFFPHSPWLTLPHNGRNEADLRTTGAVSPQVIDVTPPNNAEGVATGTNIVVQFSEDVLASTITPSTFRLLQDATPVAATLSLSASRRLATLDPTSALSAGVLYTVQVTSGVQDLAGHAALAFGSSFRVAANPPEDGLPLPKAADETVPPPGAGTTPFIGTAVAGAGDLDGDGLQDFVAGAPGSAAGALSTLAVEAGAALVFLGSSSGAERVTPDIIFNGVAAHDRTGVSVASNFDFNGDGHNDILIGAEQFNRTDPNPANHVATGAGKAYLILFNPADTTLYPNLANPAVPDVLDLAGVGTTIPGGVFLGKSFGDQAGFSVAGGGLLDAGQTPDLLIGAPGVDMTQLGMLANAGSAYGLFNGPLTSPVNLGNVACTHKSFGPCAPAAEVPGVIYQGDLLGMQAGFSVAFVGPLIDDPPVAATGNAAIGAPTANFGAPLSPLGGVGAGGMILVEAGDEDTSIIGVCSIGVTEPGAQIRGDQAGMQLGASVADGGDARADGRPDVLIGAPTYGAAAGTDAGAVLQLSTVLQSGIYTSSDVGTTIGGVVWTGAAAGDQLGYAVAGLGDVTGDGFDDVALGAPFADPAGVADAGAVYVIAGAPPAGPSGGVVSVDAVGNTVAGGVFVGIESGEHAGASLAAAGDVNGGGVDDFLVGAPDLDSSTGAVYIVLPDDGDGDGRADVQDCNAAGGQVWDVPSEATGMALAHDHGTGVTTISWVAPLEKGGLGPLTYDTVRSSNRTDFVSAAVCVETDGSDTVSTDTFVPPPGASAYYLVVSQNSCGAGLAGSTSNGDAIVATPCPRPCTSAAQCPGSDTDCQMRTCNAGFCGISYTVGGTPTGTQTPGDCQTAVCDGAGGVTNTPNAGDMPADDGNQCTGEVCNGGSPSYPAQPINTPCNQGGGQVCSPIGSCVQCNMASQCPGPDTDCQVRACSATTCGFSYTAPGTATGAQTAGNCQAAVCDGSGGVVNTQDNADVPVDGNQCTDDQCSGGVPSNPPLAANSPCNQSGGSACNGSGSCILPPHVVGTNPPNGVSVPAGTTIAVQFSRSMNAATLTAQTTAGACSATIQLSLDNFSSCLSFQSGTPSMSGGNTVATLVPQPGLLVNRIFKIRVTTAGQDSFGLPLGATFTQTTGFNTTSPNTCDNSLVISQIYTSGGTAGASLRNDFIELHNRGTLPITLAGKSIQYANAVSSGWAGQTNLFGTIQPGRYFLVQGGSDGANGALLPTPDLIGTINMTVAAGKLALVANQTPLSGSCPLGTNVIDFVGYGTTANCNEGGANAAQPTATTSIGRLQNGCVDLGLNNSDFAAGAPGPRNSATPSSVCNCIVHNESSAATEIDFCATSPASLTIQQGAPGSMFSQVFEAGVTEPAGPSPNLRVQFGFGPPAANPEYQPGWSWFNANYNVQVGSTDTYVGSFTGPAAGTYRYAYRFSLDSGVSFTYCDGTMGDSGAGSSPGLTFDLGTLPTLTTTP